MGQSVSSHFIVDLLNYELPNTSKITTRKIYNGKVDPDSYIDNYEWTMISLKLDEKLWSTFFPTTLDNIGMWFKMLAPESIFNFAKLKYNFLTNIM